MALFELVGNFVDHFRRPGYIYVKIEIEIEENSVHIDH